MPFEAAHQTQRLADIEPPRQPLRAAAAAQPAPSAGARIDRPRRAMRCRHRRGDIGAGAATGIDNAQRLEPIERLGISGTAFALPPHRGFPIDPEPGEIIKDRRFIFGAAARGIDILDPHQEAPAVRPGQPPASQRRQRMAAVEPPGGRRGKARHDHATSFPRKFVKTSAKICHKIGYCHLPDARTVVCERSTTELVASKRP